MRTVAKHIGRVGALAVAMGIGTAVVSPAPASAESTELKPSTALLLSGTGGPKWNDAHVAVIMDEFVKPAHPDRQFTQTVAVTTPNEAWPLTGVLRILGFAFGDPSLGRPPGEFWPDEPLWKLSGLFDLTGDESIEAGVSDLEEEMARHPGEPLVIYGYSQGAVVAVKEKRKLAEQYPKDVEGPDIAFVLGGNVGVPNGGFGARFPGLHIPILEWTYDGADPTNTQFQTTVITHRYDFFADFPLYPVNFIADANAVLGLLYVHTWPFNVSLSEDSTTSPGYLKSVYGDTTYYLFDNPDLPLFGPLRTLGVPEPVIDVFEPFFRELVELGYDRSIPQGEPTPARLIPRNVDPVKVTTDLINAVGEGFDNAKALVGAPAAPDTAVTAERDAEPPTARDIRARTPIKDALRDLGNRVTQVVKGRDRAGATAGGDVTHPTTAKGDRKTPLRDAATAMRGEIKKVATKVTDRVRNALGRNDEKQHTDQGLE